MSDWKVGCTPTPSMRVSAARISAARWAWRIAMCASTRRKPPRTTMLQMLRSGRLRTESVTHRFPFSEMTEAWRTVTERRTLKTGDDELNLALPFRCTHNEGCQAGIRAAHPDAIGSGFRCLSRHPFSQRRAHRERRRRGPLGRWQRQRPARPVAAGVQPGPRHDSPGHPRAGDHAHRPSGRSLRRGGVRAAGRPPQGDLASRAFGQPLPSRLAVGAPARIGRRCGPAIPTPVGTGPGSAHAAHPGGRRRHPLRG